MGQSVILHMNEDPTPLPPPNTTPLLDGLTVGKGGILFTFSNPSGTLSYGFVLNTIQLEQYVKDPAIFGNQSSFSVAFSVPVGSVQFGLAVNNRSPIGTMASVGLVNSKTSPLPFATLTIGSSDRAFLPAGVGHPFAEDLFTYNDPLHPVTQITITPTPTDPNTGLPVFTTVTFDELVVTPAATPAATVPAATPLTLVLTAIGLAGLTMLLLRKQAA
jgi:hypothetical protein